MNDTLFPPIRFSERAAEFGKRIIEERTFPEERKSIKPVDIQIHWRGEK